MKLPENLMVQTCWPFGLLPDKYPDIVFVVAPGLYVLACPGCGKVTKFSSVIKQHMCGKNRSNLCINVVKKFANFMELIDYQTVSKTTNKPSGPVRYEANLKDICYKTHNVTDSQAFYKKSHEEPEPHQYCKEKVMIQYICKG